MKSIEKKLPENATPEFILNLHINCFVCLEDTQYVGSHPVYIHFNNDFAYLCDRCHSIYLKDIMYFKIDWLTKNQGNVNFKSLELPDTMQIPNI